MPTAKILGTHRSCCSPGLGARMQGIKQHPWHRSLCGFGCVWIYSPSPHYSPLDCTVSHTVSAPWLPARFQWRRRAGLTVASTPSSAVGGSCAAPKDDWAPSVTQHSSILAFASQNKAGLDFWMFLKVTSFKKNWATPRKWHLNFEANILCGAPVLVQLTQSGIPNTANFKFSSFQVTVNITTHHDCGREAWASSSCHMQLHFSSGSTYFLWVLFPHTIGLLMDGRLALSWAHQLISNAPRLIYWGNCCRWWETCKAFLEVAVK